MHQQLAYNPVGTLISARPTYMMLNKKVQPVNRNKTIHVSIPFSAI